MNITLALYQNHYRRINNGQSYFRHIRICSLGIVATLCSDANSIYDRSVTMYEINIQNNDINIEDGKIWLYLTVEKKQIHLQPPENISMKCHKVSIDTFLQIIKDGLYLHKNVFYSLAY